MDIKKMHEEFRTIGQQMGMQLIRGILPDSIDTYINSAIADKTQTELLNAVKNSIEKGDNSQNSTMQPINLFRTLYRNARFKLNSTSMGKDTDLVKFYNPANGYYELNAPTINSKVTVTGDDYLINPMMYLGLSLEYGENSRGSSVDCRLIGEDVIQLTLSDYCSKADKLNPIATIIGAPIILEGKEDTKGTANSYIKIYTDTEKCDIKYLNIRYIKNPNIVKFSEVNSECVNCDLPEYAHHDIVNLAVQKFLTSINAKTPTYHNS